MDPDGPKHSELRRLELSKNQLMELPESLCRLNASLKQLRQQLRHPLFLRGPGPAEVMEPLFEAGERVIYIYIGPMFLGRTPSPHAMFPRWRFDFNVQPFTWHEKEPTDYH